MSRLKTPPALKYSDSWPLMSDFLTDGNGADCRLVAEAGWFRGVPETAQGSRQERELLRPSGAVAWSLVDCRF
jgi:hypothetical protein